MWVGQKVCQNLPSPRVFRIGFGKIVKLRCSRAELEAMDYVRRHTLIPIPRIHKTCGGGSEDSQDVIMQYVKGEPLDVAWKDMTKNAREAVCKELAGYIDQLRRLIPPKPGFVGSVSLGPALDYRFGQDKFGPFETVGEFHNFVRLHNFLERWKEEKEVLQVHSNKSYTSKLTHADLSPGNIVVRRTKIVAIVDWETAGWFPEYWEFTKLRYQCWLPRWEPIYKKMSSYLVQYPVELLAEQAIWKRYDWCTYEAAHLLQERKLANSPPN